MYTGAVQDLIDQFGKLPGIGPKSAQRLAFHVLALPAEQVEALSEALLEVKRVVRFCDRCGNISEGELCSICSDARRNPALLCVVQEPKDIPPIERTREYRGLYHVLGGAIDPMRGIGPDDLRIRELFGRLESGEVTEVILATNPNIEGDATAAYVGRQLRGIGVPVSRLASGLPVGGDLEYADEVTLGRALEGRRPVA
jgi:recombination protein RecR